MRAFRGCSHLSNAFFTTSPANIGNSAFISCGFADLTIPEGVTNIGDYAFMQCTKLTNISMLPVNPPAITTNTFNSCNNLVSITLGSSSSSNSYVNAYRWSEYSNIIC